MTLIVAVRRQMVNSCHYRDRVVPVLVLKAYGEWRYSSTIDVLNTRLSIYHVNQ